MSFSCPKKQISYRGGLIHFYIPNHWIEEYESEGGGTFCAPADETGTLRVNVHSFLMKEDATSKQLLDIVQKGKVKNDAQTEPLPGDRFLLKYCINGEENGISLIIYCWEVAKMVSPHNFNIAVFTFAVTAVHSERQSVRDEVLSIEEEVKKVHFGVPN